MSSKHRAMICNGCKHYAKSHHYCCAEHKALPAIAVPVTCTAFAPRIASNAEVCGPAPLSPTAEKPTVAGSDSTVLLADSEITK